MIKYFLRRFFMKTEDCSRYQLYLSATYAFLAMNTFVYVFYVLAEDNIPNTPEKKKKYIERMQQQGYNVSFKSIGGLTRNYNSEDNTKPTLE